MLTIAVVRVQCTPTVTCRMNVVVIMNGLTLDMEIQVVVRQTIRGELAVIAAPILQVVVEVLVVVAPLNALLMEVWL